MTDRKTLIDQLTYPHLGTPSRVTHTLGYAPGDERRDLAQVVEMQAKLLGMLISKLQQSGVLSNDDVDDVLLESTL